MNINEEILAAVVEHIAAAHDLENVADVPGCWDADDLNTVIQELLTSPTPLDLPDGSEAVAYYMADGDDGFIFALRPSVWNVAQVATSYQDARDFEPRDKDGNSLWDGGKISAKEIVRQVAENVASELNSLVPAYEKLFGVPKPKSTKRSKEQRRAETRTEGSVTPEQELTKLEDLLNRAVSETNHQERMVLGRELYVKSQRLKKVLTDPTDVSRLQALTKRLLIEVFKQEES